jgi:hypothetical protein
MLSALENWATAMLVLSIVQTVLLAAILVGTRGKGRRRR